MAEGGNKSRLDELLLARGLSRSLNEAESLIRAGRVYVDENQVDKPGHRFRKDAPIRLKELPPYVSRGGVKLAGALHYFNIDPSDWVCGDFGASTGGFTDCLLQHGAQHVFAVDVAYGLLHWKLRTDPRVRVLERVNIRNLTPRHITEPLDLAVFDTSFISLSKVIPPVLPLFGTSVRILALIKPQFEVARHLVGQGGIVHSEALRLKAVEAIASFAHQQGLICRGYTESQIRGAKGNQEYLMYLVQK